MASAEPDRGAKASAERDHSANASAERTAALQIFAIPGIPEGTAGLDIGRAIAEAATSAKLPIEPGDAVVVAQKLVSKAEGAVVALSSVVPSELAAEWGASYGKDPAVVEVVLREARRIVRMDRGVVIAETRHGFVCANAGVDVSNVPEGFACVLPQDPDASAARIREAIAAHAGAVVGVIVSDTFGRAWREGAVNVAIGIAGLQALIDCRGTPDQFGRLLQTTVIAIADEIAAAADLVMGKSTRTPVAIVRGGIAWAGEGEGARLVRAASTDLFR